MIDLETLAAELRVSSSTIRRDVENLEKRGLVTRTHGGVIWSGETSVAAPGPDAFDQRLAILVQPKQRIARMARNLVRAGDTILLDGGTTTLYFAQELVGQQLQLVTNSLPIANLFSDDEHVELVVVGGLLYPRYGVLLGPTAEHALESIHTKTLFFSAAGIHEGAIYNQNLLLVQSERRMLERAQQVVLLADHSKFGRQALNRLCSLEEVDVIVTDQPVPPEHESAIRNAGCQLLIAD